MFRKILTTKTIVAFFSLFILALGFARAEEGEGYENLCTIESPEKLENVEGWPVLIAVAFHEGAQLETFRAWLNQNEITDRFFEIEGGKAAFVSPQDGLRIREEDKAIDTKVNIIKTIVEGEKNKIDVDVRNFFVKKEELEEVPEGEEFFEEVPGWRTPDLAVTSLTANPDMADPGSSITLRSSVANLGTGTTSAAQLVLLVDNVEITRKSVSPLAPTEALEFASNWTATGLGRHQVTAKLEYLDDDFDPSIENNLQTKTVVISGETDPQPELEFAEVDFDALQLTAGESAIIPVKVRNFSFATITDVLALALIDGEPVTCLTDEGPLEVTKIDTIKDIPPPTIGCDVINLAPGEEQTLQVLWDDVTRGGHIVEIQVPELLSGELKYVTAASWSALVPDVIVLYDEFQKDKWVSIGPRILTHGVGGLPTDSVGRMDDIAFDLTTIVFKTMYVGSPYGGLWRTVDQGKNWKPLTDKERHRNIGTVAVDPQNGSIIYYATGSSEYGGGRGIFKSIDGGQNWHLFADQATELIGLPPVPSKIIDIRGASKLEIRYLASGELMIYAASNNGLLRYKSTNPQATTSSASEWIMLRNGAIIDMEVHPTNPSLVYASVDKTGLYRTRVGATMTGDAWWLDWDLLDEGLPDLTLNKRTLRLDLVDEMPSTIYATVRYPFSCREVDKFCLNIAVYRSLDEGDTWKYLLSTWAHSTPYNPFVRVLRADDYDLVYFGGVRLYRTWIPKTLEAIKYGFFGVERVEGIHDDMQGMEWDPWVPPYPWDYGYYILGDGGIWHCLNAKRASNFPDQCVSLNRDLRVTEFYDFDASQTDPDLMIGGTQDNGTIMYQGTLDWKIIKGNDGLYSLISPSNSIFYGQEQYLTDTGRCEKGINCWVYNLTEDRPWGSWRKASSGLPSGYDNRDECQIVHHPENEKELISQGDQVYWTDSGGDQWKKIGPTSSDGLQGLISRVAYQPNTNNIVAGTSRGQIWIGMGNPPSPTWHVVFTHPEEPNREVRVNSLAFSPVEDRALYVTFSNSTRDHRIYLLVLSTNSGPASADPYPVAGNFPSQYQPRVIAADGHEVYVAYVGTERGVYRGEANCAICQWTWQHYDDGLPWVRINDLLVDPTSKLLRAATRGRGAWSVITGP